jgi:GNAT superfamily N-acetyltransferase
MASRYGMEIRAATAIEAPGISMLLAAAGHVIAPRDIAERLAALRDTSAAALVALQWGPPSGIVVFHWYRTLYAARPIAQITTLLVGEDERRRGIGRMLLKAASQAARMAGCGELEIAATTDAPSLHAFCRETGFTEIGPVFVRSLRKQI